METLKELKRRKKMNLTELKEPFENIRWRILLFNNTKTSCMCTPYVDARAVEDRFDKVCGQENWQDKYYSVKDTMFCAIGIKISDEWVWKSGAGVEKESYGEEDDLEIKLKGEASDALKLAGVKWGVGRLIYKMTPVWLPYDKAKKKVMNGNTPVKNLTEYINARLLNPDTKKEDWKETTEKKGKHPNKKKDFKGDEFSCKQQDIKDYAKILLGKEQISQKTFDETIKASDSADNMGFLLWHELRCFIISNYWEIVQYLTEEEREHYRNQMMTANMGRLKQIRKEFEEIGKANDIILSDEL